MKKFPKTTHWNYRIVVERDSYDKNSLFYSIREVYYENDIPHSWVVEPQYPIGETMKELMNDFNSMKEAFKKPPLFVKGDKIYDKKQDI